MTLRAHAEEKRYPFSFTNHGEKVTDRDRVKSFEFVVTKTGEDQGPGFANTGHAAARRAFEEVESSFTLLERLPLPDGSYLELFKRRSAALDPDRSQPARRARPDARRHRRRASDFRRGRRGRRGHLEPW